MKEIVDDSNLNRNSKNDKRNEATTNTATTVIRHNYVVTGVVANARLSPLLPKEWVDITPNRVDASDDARSTTCNNSTDSLIPSFLWENSPRQVTKGYRDDVTVYSHLPNGINILDSKWVLGRLFADDYDTCTQDSRSKKVNRNPLLATCKTHCFCGLNGFNKFAESVKLITTDNNNDHNDDDDEKKRRYELEKIIRNLPDLAVGSSKSPSHLSAEQKLVVDRPPINMLNWWVVKDAGSNGAGGVWVVGRENAKAFGDCDSGTSPLFESHKYVAQEYVWPPVLYDGKKCHVRVYVTITCDGQAFIHRRAFLHVANDNFTIYNDDTGSDDGQQPFKDSTHITNCCANSHDDDKFAGEILADFCETEYTTWKSDDGDDLKQQPIIPLADFFPSVQATVSAVAQKTFKKGFIDGGQKNNGFEYCGMDFMLSYKKKEDVIENNSDEALQPVAYLLEINSPPSQDTASSLPHAENLHNEVLRDWMTYWVIPKIDHNYLPVAGGWQRCSVSNSDITSTSTSTSTGTGTGTGVEQVNNNHERKEDLILPSKASILNKIRWALFESKVQKNKMQQNGGNQDRNDEVININEHDNNNDNTKGTQLQSNVKHDDNGDDYVCNDNANTTAIEISRFARSQFPFFSSSSCLTNGDVANHQNDNNNKSTFNDSKQQQQQIFFENAGGTQVPQSVIDCVQTSLIRRHREIIGNETKAAARETLRKILVGGNEKKTGASSAVLLGLNATSLLVSLAQRYVQLLSSTDEVVLSTENHVANFEPWIEAVTAAGATIKLWTPFQQDEHSSSSSSSSSSSLPPLSKYETSSNLNDLITPHTRVVALPHASNVLGSIRPISALSKMIKYRSKGYAHVVVDGVAVAAHAFVGLDENFGGNVDWYVVSIHKLFGPHLGVLMANQQSKSIEQFLKANDPSFLGTTTHEERLQTLLESGTANNESCAGAKGLGMYFKLLSNWYEGKLGKKSAFTTGIIATDTMVSMREVRLVYSLFRKVEMSLLKSLIRRLSRYPLVRILDGSSMEYLHCGSDSSSSSSSSSGSDRSALLRLPTVSFVHKIISSRDIYTFCLEKGIICRHGFFLCTNYLSVDFNISDNQDGVFRISLAHYNTSQEVETLCDNFEKMPRWND